jgi:hypothetical protein
MRRTWRTGILALLIGLVVGAGIGLATGWWAWPVRFTDAEVSDLRPVDQDTFVVLVSDAYAQNGDLAAAQDAVSRLALPDTTARLQGIADQLDSQGRSRDADVVRRLNQALAPQ